MDALTRLRPAFLTPAGMGAITLIARVWLGAMMIVHGQPKIADGMVRLTNSLMERGWPMPMFQAFTVASIEFGGGILIIAGLFTRPLATIAAGLFTGISLMFLTNAPFGQKELALSYLLLALIVIALGPGKYSVDALLFRNKEQAAPGDRNSR
jgi:putative oxidoreductase